jgi:hypothetical protein
MQMLKIYSFIVLILFSDFANAQKEIMISDSLTANGDTYIVKLGSQGPGKIWKLHFGDYGILSSKKSWTSGSSKTNLLGTKSESKTTDKFSFVLGNKSNDTAWVNAANNINIKAMQEVEIIPHFTWGENELMEESQNFTAFISVSGDTTETWTLLMNTTKGTRADAKSEAFLTNGDLKIRIIPSVSGKSKSMFSVPVGGYEFTENEHSISALQYAGMFGANKNIIWLGKDLDPKMKMILAAAATAILEKELVEMEKAH